jgi:hypothetical protein
LYGQTSHGCRVDQQFEIPAASSLRRTSLKGSGLSGTDVDLNGFDERNYARRWRLEVKLKGFLQIDQRFLVGGALAGNIDFQALSNVQIVVLMDACSKLSLHG